MRRGWHAVPSVLDVFNDDLPLNKQKAQKHMLSLRLSKFLL